MVWSSPTTAATAYAPSTFGDGSYQWRVTAYDASNNAIASSSWRAFTVDHVAPVVTNYTPNPSGTPKSKVQVTFSEKVLGSHDEVADGCTSPARRRSCR